MTTNEELITELNGYAAEPELILDCEMPMLALSSLLGRAEDALKATQTPVEVTERERLITEALERSRKGVQEDDGYTYSIPASDIAATNDLLRRLAEALSIPGAPAAGGETEWAVKWIATESEPVTDIGADERDVRVLARTQAQDAVAVRRTVGPWVPVESEEGAS